MEQNRVQLLKLEKSKPDGAWVANLAETTVKRASEYVSEAMEDFAFQKQMVRVLETGGRNNYVQIAAPFELYALGRLLRPDHIVEIGVSAGVSSAYLLKATRKNGRGRLHSIDLPEPQIGTTFSPDKNSHWCLPPGRYSGWAVQSSLRSKWDLRLGSSAKLLSKLIDEIGTVGLFLYDVPYSKAGAISDFQIVDKKLREGSVVIADNCLVPLAWWAKTRNEIIHHRRRTGLHGFRINRSKTILEGERESR